MNIYILIPTLTIGGAESIALSSATEFSRQGHNVEIILLESKIEVSIPENINVKIIQSKNPISKFYCIVQYLRSKNNIYILSYMERCNFINTLLSFFLDANICLSVHTAPKAAFKKRALINKFFISITYLLARFKKVKVLAVSQGIANDLKKLYGIERVKFIPNFIDRKDIRIRSNLASIPVDNDKINILFLGRLSHIKGCHILINAMRKLNEDKCSNIELRIIGDGDDMLFLKDTSKGYDNIKFKGMKNNPFPYLKSSDYIVVPSYAEGFGMIILEALSLHKKVIYSLCDFGPKEILSNKLSFMGISFSDPSINEYNSICELHNILSNLNKYELDISEKEMVEQCLDNLYSKESVVYNMVDYLKSN